MRKITRLWTAAALALPACAWADIYAYVAMPLTPTQEPTAPNSVGRGSTTVLYDSTTKVLMYSVVYQLNAGATATAAHFHGPAPLGSNAGVAIGLPVQPTGNQGKLTGTVTLTAAQEVDLLAGRWYFNLHSSLATGGELRSQLLENSASLMLPTFEGGVLTLPMVLTPGLGNPASYSATLRQISGNTFELTGATPQR